MCRSGSASRADLSNGRTARFAKGNCFVKDERPERVGAVSFTAPNVLIFRFSV
jgi:hypothetical protein